MDERPVDVETMRDYAERYRQMELQLLNTEAEITALEEECQEYAKVESFRLQEAVDCYMLYRGHYEQKARALDAALQQCQTLKDRLQGLLGELREVQAKLESINAEKEMLIKKINGIAVVHQEQKLKSFIASLREKITSLESKQLKLLQQVKADLRDRRS